MNFPNEITITPNKPAVLGVGTLKIFTDASVLFATFTEADVTVVGSTFVIDVTNLAPPLGSYYYIISKGLFKSVGNEPFSVVDVNELVFEIANGDWLNTDWNNSDWFTN